MVLLLMLGWCCRPQHDLTAEMRTVAALLLLLDSALASWDTDNATMAQAEYEGDKIEFYFTAFVLPQNVRASLPPHI